MSAHHRLSSLIIAASVMVFLANGRGQAQQQPKRIGFLAGVSQSAIAGRLNAFREGLRHLGYLENKNILIEFRSAEENMERLRGFAAELVHLKVHVMLRAGRQLPALQKSQRPRLNRMAFQSAAADHANAITASIRGQEKYKRI